MLKNKYEVETHTFFSPDDGEYVSVVYMVRIEGQPIIGELTGVSASGATIEDSMRELGIATELALEVYEEDAP